MGDRHEGPGIARAPHQFGAAFLPRGGPEIRRVARNPVMLTALAGVCVQRGYTRFEWSVLDWNAPAIAFYRSVGAIGMDDWTVQRVTGDALRALAQT